MTYSLDITDEKLVEKIAEGDEIAFQILIKRHESMALNIAYRFIGNTHDAQDIAQEAFLRLFKNAQYYTPTAKVKTWFFRIIANLCIDFLRKKKPLYYSELFDVPSEAAAPDIEAENAERQRIVQGAIQALPPNQRLALIFHHYEGFKYKEIAEMMGCSVKAVESLLVRANQNLRERLSKYIKSSLL